MSAYDWVFLKPAIPMTEEQLARRLEGPLGVRFEEQPEEFAYVTALSNGCALDLGRHEFESDRGMRFSDYPFVIAVRAFGSSGPREQAAEARRVFEALRATAELDLLWTYDLQARRGSYEPPPAGAPGADRPLASA